MSANRAEIGAADRAAWERHLGGPVPPTLRTDLAAGTIPAAARATADRHGDRVAVSVHGDSLTHRQLVRRMDALAGWLTARGVASGDRVLLCAPNSIDFVTTYLGALAAGATAVLANPAATEAELSHLVADSGATVAVTDVDREGRLRSASSTLDVVAFPGDGFGSDVLESSAPLQTGPESVAVLAYTSGTTGVPKSTPLTHANILASTRGALAAWRWRSDDVCLHALPLYHQHGLSAVHAAIVSGSQVRVVPRLDGQVADVPSVRDRATVIFAVPAIYQRLAESGDLEILRTLRLRLAVSGSAPLSADLAEEIEATTGALPLERYGTTESGLNLSNPYIGPRRPGRVGLPLPGVEVRLRDRAGAESADGDEGEICVRGPQVFSGYETPSTEYGETFWPGPWFRTGDIGVRDPADGSYAIVGRSKELIVTGGLNVYPREVELALSQHADVADVAVAGVSSEQWGEEVTAFVVAAPGRRPDAQELVDHCRELLTPYKCPKRIVMVDVLPRGGTGKILRARLVQGLR